MEQIGQNIQQKLLQSNTEHDEKDRIFQQYFMLLKLFNQIKFIQQQEITQKNQMIKHKQQNLLFNYKLFQTKNEKKYIRWQRYWFYLLIKQFTHTYNPDIVNFEETAKQFMNFLLQKQLVEDQEHLVKREQMIEQTSNFGISCGKFYKLYDSLPSHPFFCVTIKSIDQRFKVEDDSSGVFILVAKNIIGQILYISFFKIQNKSNSLIIFSRFLKQNSLMIILDEIQGYNNRISQRCLDLLKQAKVDFVYIPISGKKQKNPIFSQKIPSHIPPEDYYINLLIHFKELQKDDQKIFDNKNVTQISIIKQIVKVNYQKGKLTKSKQFQEFIKDEIKEIQYIKKYNEERINHHFPEKQDRSRKCKNKICKKKSVYRCIGCSIQENQSVALCVLCFKPYHDCIFKQKGKEVSKKQQATQRKSALKSKKLMPNLSYVKEQEDSPTYKQVQNFTFQLKIPEVLLFKMDLYFHKVQQLQNSYINAIKNKTYNPSSITNQSQKYEKCQNNNGGVVNFLQIEQSKQNISNSNSNFNSSSSKNDPLINQSIQHVNQCQFQILGDLPQDLVASSLKAFKILSNICQEQQQMA